VSAKARLANRVTGGRIRQLQLSAMSSRPSYPYPDLAPEPVARAAVVQRWEALTFLHWRYPPETVQAILPPGLEVEVFDGSAWVALVPFRMVRVRPPWAPPLGPLTTFPETNVRTYVRGPDGGSGVWFMSLDITRLLGVAVARMLFHVPYAWSKMTFESQGRTIRYGSRRRWPAPRGTTSRVEIGIGESVGQSDLTRFLTNRWRAYTALGNGGIAFAPVAHEPWSLRTASVISLHDEVVAASGLPPPEGPPLVHFAERVSARVGHLTRA
jgi:uncharacterized protein